MASEKRRGGIEGPLQLRRSLHHSERLPARMSLAAQLIACTERCADPSNVEAPPIPIATEEDVASGSWNDFDSADEVTEFDEADDVGESVVIVSLE